MAVFLHQLAYLFSALLGRAALTSEQAAGRLIRACAMGRGGNDLGEDDLQAEEEDGDAERDETDTTLRSHVWSAEGPECHGCGGGRGNYARITPSARPAMALRGERGAGVAAH